MVQSELQLQAGTGGRADASNRGDGGSDKGGPDNSDMPTISPDSQRPPKLCNLTYDSPPDYLRTVSCPETCRVLFDYHPEAPDELALRKGDLVKVLRKTTEDKGWWEGECHGQRGVFPDNFVIPPPPVKRLVQRQVLSRESALIKEPKHLMRKTSLPNVKKLPTVASEPSKVKISSTPCGDGQRRPFRDSGSNGRLNGGPRHPGRKQSQTQAPRRHSASSKEQDQSSLAKSPTMNKSPTPEKTSLPDKAPSPEKIAAADKVPTPEKAQTLDDMAPTPEKIVDSNKTATTKTTVDKASGPERGFSGDEAPALEAPPRDEVLDPKMSPEGDKAPTPISVLTPEQMLSEEAPPKDSAQLEHFSPEETPQKAKSLVVIGAQSQKETYRPEESPQSSKSSQDCCCMVNLRDSSLRPQSKSEPGYRPTLCKTCHQKDITLTEGTKNEATPQKEAPLTEETPLKEVPPKELPSKGLSTEKEIPPKEEVASKRQVPPKEAAFTSQASQTTLEMIPEPQETPTLHSLVLANSRENENNKVETAALKEEVGSLKRALELLELQVEEKMTEVWEEMKNERERRQLLEVQMLQRTLKTRSVSSKHAETQTQ